MPLTAADVMTREVITVTPSTPISEFARICAEDRISGAPVVAVDGRLLGVVRKHDHIPRHLEGNNAREARGDVRAIFNVDEDDDEAPSMPDADDPAEVDLGSVEEIMQSEVVTVAPGDAVPGIARRMAKERIHRVLVVEKARLVGIITSLDLLGHFAAEGRGRAGAAKAKAKSKPRSKPKPPAAKRKRR